MLILGLKRLISSYLYRVQGGFSSYVASHVDVLRSNPGGGGYSHTLPIRVCAAQRGRDFEAPDLERGIYFGGVF